MSNPMVSVLVTVYRQEKTVRKTLESVLGQTFQDWEMIVTDDHSPDNGLAEIRKVHDPRIRVVAREKNSGLANIPRNEMIRMARGRYLAFLDGDDLWHPEKLKRQVEFMTAHPECPFCHVGCEVVDSEGRSLYLRNWGNYPANGDCFAELMRKCFICTSAVMVDRRLVEEVGGFSEDPKLRNNGDDTEFFLRCAKTHKIGMPNAEPLMQYRWSGDSLTHHPDHWKPGLDLLKRRYLWDGKMSETEVRQIVWETWMERCFEMRREGRWGPAAWFAWGMIRLNFLRIQGWRMLGASVLHRR